MIEIVAGDKGKGKTKVLLEKSNEDIKNINGSIIFVDKSSKHMYDLDSKVRLVDTQEYAIKNYDALYGMICGILSQDYDISTIFVDSVTKIVKGGDIIAAEDVFAGIADVCEKHNVSMIITASIDANEVPEYMKKYL